ncbi:MAG: TonB-dependent receptor domain-containing protein [Longimicrobiaceae bacterium]
MFTRLVRNIVPILFLAAVPAAAQETGSIRGTVVAAGTAEALVGVTVRIQGTRRAATTGAAGAFTITRLAPGGYTLTAERLGYQPATVAVAVDAGRAAEVRIELRPGAVVLQGVTAIGSTAELGEVRERMAQVPGSVHLVTPEEIRATRQANLGDVLRFVPGVYAAARFGAADETQLSIRGSGLRNNFHLRGVNLLVNGMPYRNADGFTDFESLELLTTEDVQVYKGANALRYGGSTLGGAIDLETKTGYTSSPFNAVAEGGSQGFFKGQASSGAVLGRFNYYASYARTDLDGYREHSAQQRDRVNLHLGYALSPNVDLRTFYLFAHVREELPGSLTAAELESDPTLAVPGNVANRWGRDYDLHHVGVQVRAQLGRNTRLEAAPYFQYRDIVHPIFRVIDQVSRDWGAELRVENTTPLGGQENRLTVGVQPSYGNVDDKQFVNAGGDEGALAKDQRDVAGGVAVYAEDALRVAPRLTAVVGMRYARDVRRVADRFLSDGDQSGRRLFEAWMPRAGLLYELPSVGGQLFANASRTSEPPLLLELNSLTVPGFVDVDAQDAWQFEVGTRGRRGGVEWNVAAYDVELRDEILNQNVQPFPGAPFTVPTYRNAERTRHYGVETGLGYTLPAALLTAAGGGDRLGARIAYTFARYRFVRDAGLTGNDIPGAPGHVLQGELVYRHPIGLTLRPNVEWVPSEYFVDSGNTAKNEGWMVFGARAELLVARLKATAFVEARNLTDVRYSPSVQVDDAAGRFFNPADGRSLYAGVRWQP